MDGGGLAIPGPGSAPDEEMVAFAAGLIDRSGKAPVIEAPLAHRTGRRRPLPVRAVLTALLCLALDDRPLFLTEATRLLFSQLSPPYQLKHKDGPDADGYQRLSCPALGHHPGLICPLRQASLSPRDGRPKVLLPPEEPPKICRQTAITIAPGTGARYRQDLPYASPAWQARYATLRNTIEGLNGYAKDPARQALAQPGRRRVRGIAACSLFTALLLMVANSRKIRAWRALTDSAITATAQRARRRRASLRDYLPDG